MSTLCCLQGVTIFKMRSYNPAMTLGLYDACRAKQQDSAGAGPPEHVDEQVSDVLICRANTHKLSFILG